MNCILKLWTYNLTRIGTQKGEAKGIFSHTAYHRNIYERLSTRIIMYEDANIYISKRDIYTAYSDCKGAFGGMDRRILFQLTKDYGFQHSYIAACKQLYSVSNIYNITMHGNNIPLPIYRGTLQGDTISPFLFTILMEPLLRWLSAGSRGYKPH
jgi:hypothetical protein